MLKKGNDPLGTVMFNISGYHVKLDREDLEKVVRKAWHVRGSYFRHTTKNGEPNITLHRYVIVAKKQQIVDHINGNTLDNRKKNLRFVTPQQSTWNRGPHKGIKYKGIEKKLYKGGKWTGRWIAKLRKNGKTYKSKSFPTMEQAARARDKLSRKHHGQYARLNFPTRTDMVKLRKHYVQ